ncbi:uncharacterized protein Eint_070670 [Encephalitozoon intestinalis ATCC 50506]|uniref:Uncharacterized protein n=1 Tax=Encephalitozoon intestinalis (strain ATCC 50506) TaxID=876142 RepID=E0S7Z6_ENCIT|nr:uncharacterized protein Eint_070670 [Encephalitozoon intestinalis ATCC 50506]ADM11831.1 hypothetical protein Eint_070670 [Encephalitozoon intestinalis ATCC 50506]UTX45581.1 hypothetical protein GPK93_07g11450 [Encephalitozoon intestinalis]
MAREYKETVYSILASLCLVGGLSLESFVCKTANCSFFLSSTLFISMALTLLSLAHMVRTKAKVTLFSAYKGSISALMDIMIVFIYTKILCTNSLFFCLSFLTYQMTVSILTCFTSFSSSGFMVCICVIFLSPLFDLWFVEEHGFSRSQIPDFMKYYITNGSMNIIFFIPIVGIRVMFGEFFGRLENRESSTLFNSLGMVAIGAILGLIDRSAFLEEFRKMYQVSIPFVVSNIMLVTSLAIFRWNKNINFTSVYPPVSVLSILVSGLFCYTSAPLFWRKTILECSLNAPYLFYLLTFSLFTLYIIVVYKSNIVSRPARDGFIPGVTWWLWG